MGHTYICHKTECYSVMRVRDILPFPTIRMDLEDIILREISQRQILYDNKYMWYLKKPNS